MTHRSQAYGGRKMMMAPVLFTNISSQRASSWCSVALSAKAGGQGRADGQWREWRGCAPQMTTEFACG